MIRGEADLQKILLCGLDEADKKDIDDPVFDGEEFFNEKTCAESDEVDPELDEAPDTEEQLPEEENIYNKPVWRVSMEWPGDLGGYGIHLAYGDNEAEAIANAEAELKSLGIEAKAKCAKLSPYSKSMHENSVEENHGWYGGGYGGTGKSYSRLSHEGGHIPRGKEIGWYNVSDLDPKAKGKANGWRCGPANFPFVDELYNNRRYHKFTMMLRHPGFGGSGHIQIAIPSYFDAIKNNDNVALDLLHKLGLPLDLTFGMNPDDDYSSQYDIIN